MCGRSRRNSSAAVSSARRRSRGQRFSAPSASSASRTTRRPPSFRQPFCSSSLRLCGSAVKFPSAPSGVSTIHRRSSRRSFNSMCGRSRRNSSADVSPVATEIARMPLACAAITSDGRVADERNRRVALDQFLAPRLADGQLRQAGARPGHLAECAEAEIIAQARRVPACASRCASGCRSPAPAGYCAASGAPAAAPRRGNACRAVPGRRAGSSARPPASPRAWPRALAPPARPARRIMVARMTGSSMPCTGMPSVVVSRPVTRRMPAASASRWCGPARRVRVPSISKRTSAW